MTLTHWLTIVGIAAPALVAIALALAAVAHRNAVAARKRADAAAEEIARLKGQAEGLAGQVAYWRKAVHTIEREGCARILSCPDRQTRA